MNYIGHQRLERDRISSDRTRAEMRFYSPDSKPQARPVFGTREPEPLLKRIPQGAVLNYDLFDEEDEMERARRAA